MENVMDQRKKIAPESVKTKKAREKLRRQWEQQDQMITPAALADTIDKIHKWIAANAVNRVHVKQKEIGLFDQNQNAVVLSEKVVRFAQKLREDMDSLGKIFDSPL